MRVMGLQVDPPRPVVPQLKFLLISGHIGAIKRPLCPRFLPSPRMIC